MHRLQIEFLPTLYLKDKFVQIVQFQDSVSVQCTDNILPTNPMTGALHTQWELSGYYGLYIALILSFVIICSII